MVKSDAQKRLDLLEMEACRFASHLTALLSRELNSQGRMSKLIRVSAMAHRRADRRYKKSLGLAV